MASTSFLPVTDQLALLRRGAVDLIEAEQLASKLERSRAENRPQTIKAG